MRSPKCICTSSLIHESDLTNFGRKESKNWNIIREKNANYVAFSTAQITIPQFGSAATEQEKLRKIQASPHLTPFTANYINKWKTSATHDGKNVYEDNIKCQSQVHNRPSITHHISPHKDKRYYMQSYYGQHNNHSKEDKYNIERSRNSSTNDL